MRIFLAIGLLVGTPLAHGVPFNWGAWEGRIETELSLDMRWAMEQPNAAWVSKASGGHAQTASSDDGRLNFRKGSAISRRLSLQQTLELRLRDTGFVLQGRLWNDFELSSSQSHASFENARRPRAAQAAGSQWLQAFVFHHYQFDERPGVVRLGRQVVHWGSSHLLASALDVINPKDGNLFSPQMGSQAEERIPVSMLYVSQALSSQWSLDAFYQLGSALDVPANCGGFFALRDVSVQGCDAYALGSTQADWAAQAQSLGLGYAWSSEGILVPRGADNKPRHSGQFGLAAFWQQEGTQLGFYWLQYHSRSGFLGAQTADAQWLSLANSKALSAGAAQAIRLGGGRYRLTYPENLRLYGFSWSQELYAGGSFWTELSYQPNAPLQENEALLMAGLAQSGDVQMWDGYTRKPMAQWQMGVRQPLKPFAGAHHMQLEAEWGYVRVMGLGHGRYGRDPAFGTEGNRGFVTPEAWGYRLALSAEYLSSWAQLRFQPSVLYTQDVQGYAPQGRLSEGARSISLGLGIVYADAYRLDLGYTGFYGGHYNPWADRDFAQLKMSLRF